MAGKKKMTKAAKLKRKREEKMTTPCPYCDKWAFNSTSGRTLHVKACEKKSKEKPKDEEKVVETIGETICPYCDKLFKANTKMVAYKKHLNSCHRYKVNSQGHIYDPKLKLWVTKAPNSCKCPAAIRSVLGCSLKLGIFPHETFDFRITGCWQEAHGECTYAGSPMTDRDGFTYHGKFRPNKKAKQRKKGI